MQLFTRLDKTATRRTIHYYLAEMQREKKSVILMAIFIPLSDVFYSVGMPLIMSIIVQHMVTGDAQPIPMLLAGMLGLGLATIVANHIGYHASFTHEERVQTRLTNMAISNLLSHSSGFFANQKVGALSGNVTNFVRSYMRIIDGLTMSASPILVSVFFSLIIIGVMAPLALIPAVILTVAVVWQALAGLQQRATLRDARKILESQHMGSIADTLSNHALVRMFARNEYEKRRIMQERKKIENLTFEEIRVMQKFSIYRMATLFIFQTLLLAICAYMSANNLISIAALIFIVTYIGRLAGSMFGINTIIRQFEQSFLDAAPLTQLLDLPKEITDMPHAKKLDVQHGAIAIEHATYQYKDSGAQIIFDDLTLTIPAGQRMGVVGRSGGGKTTLTNLLLRNMDVNAGTIRIDGQDVSRVTQNSLRESIAYVPQDPIMFHRTLRENIAYGKPNATDNEILQAAEHANALDFINETPNGLNTIVGERGVKLSGGQRQRIAIARAFLKDAPILVLDEATSALDSESEHLIQQSLEKLMNGRTCIVVAHRLSTISKLDRIIVLENGAILEDGTHEELLNNDSLYAKLWRRQSGGFIDE